MNDPSLEVAVGGTIDTKRRYCATCNEPMLYHVDENEKIEDMFCSKFGCSEFCKAIEVRD